MRRWGVPLAFSAGILLAQIVRTAALVDVVTGEAPAGVHLAYPALHVVLAPLTLLADWLNGGSTGDFIGFAFWAIAVFVLARFLLTGHAAAPTRRRAVRELVFGASFLLLCGLFIWWGARWNRPIPWLASSDPVLIIFDVHSHTSASHDGRPRFGAVANARWHARAGFDAAFVTDHNVVGAARQWQLERAGRPPRLLNGEELSLNGLHMVVLGNDSLIRNKPWNQSFDSSLALLKALSLQSYLIASLPEYWSHHWGPEVGQVIASGVQGIEIWTRSPKAMDFPAAERREVVARARSLGLAVFGATDMHGLGNAATVWNVMPLPGWRTLDDARLTWALLERFRAEPRGVRVIAMRRHIAPTRAAQIVGTPLGVIALLRAASPGHRVALLVWVWGLAWAGTRLRPSASSRQNPAIVPHPAGGGLRGSHSPTGIGMRLNRLSVGKSSGSWANGL